jgi:glycosyltransferase involved in cell wall biosynthesis
MQTGDSLRVVLVHDWLTGTRGGEKVLEVLCRRWPEAPLFALLHRRGSVSPVIEDRTIKTSFLQHFPGAHRYYRYLLPLMPLAVSRWRLPACELVISSSHCVAKAALPPAGVPHVCYCYTPMRYAWHLRQSYFGRERPGLKGRLREWLLDALREWDRRTAEQVSHFVAISRAVQRRIADCYGRPSRVIYPPVDTDFYTPAPAPRQDYYLAVSAFAPYKRLDLAIAACNQLRRRLLVIGSGQDEKRLRTLAGPTIRFLGWQPDAVIRDHLRRCRALVFPGEEDFGIVPVEAQACGTPVIAFGRGGATETVVPLNRPRCSREQRFREPTGLWFEEQTAECLAAALEDFEARAGDLSPATARRNALRFNKQRFADEIFSFLDWVLRGGLETQTPPKEQSLRKAG